MEMEGKIEELEKEKKMYQIAVICVIVLICGMSIWMACMKIQFGNKSEDILGEIEEIKMRMNEQIPNTNEKCESRNSLGKLKIEYYIYEAKNIKVELEEEYFLDIRGGMKVRLEGILHDEIRLFINNKRIDPIYERQSKLSIFFTHNYFFFIKEIETSVYMIRYSEIDKIYINYRFDPSYIGSNGICDQLFQKRVGYDTYKYPVICEDWVGILYLAQSQNYTWQDIEYPLIWESRSNNEEWMIKILLIDLISVESVLYTDNESITLNSEYTLYVDFDLKQLIIKSVYGEEKVFKYE